MAAIEALEVGTVIAKDISRLGRDYLKVGYYTEIAFPEKGIRSLIMASTAKSRWTAISRRF